MYPKPYNSAVSTKCLMDDKKIIPYKIDATLFIFYFFKEEEDVIHDFHLQLVLLIFLKQLINI